MGVVELVPSDWGWFVDGVSGRGIAASDVSAEEVSSIFNIFPNGFRGSFTDSAGSSDVGFLLLLDRLVGHGRSGLENQGN